MIHRHLDYAPGASAENLPSAAIVDILERGDLDDWKPIAAAVAREPNGFLASRVLQLVSAYPMYGTSALWRSWIDRCRTRAEPRLALSCAKSLADLRRSSGVTQSELAERISMSQSDLSKLERRSDVRISSLRVYLAGLGGELRLEVQKDGELQAIELPPTTRPPVRPSDGWSRRGRRRSRTDLG